MRIISTYLPAEPSPLTGGRSTVIAAFDTLVGEKGLVVGITVGQMDGPDLAQVRVSALGQAIIDRCGEHMVRNYPHGAVAVAGVAQVAGAVQRVRHVLKQAPQGSFVLLLCADEKVYRAAMGGLGVDLQSAKVRPQ